MEGQDRDELQQGYGDRSAWARRWAAIVVLFLLVAASGTALAHRHGDSRPAPSAARSTATPVPAQPSISPIPPAPPTPAGLPVVNPALAIASTGDVCAEIHSRRMSVSFGVANLSREAILLRRVRAVLPLGGLRLIGHSIGRASCGKTPSLRGRRLLPVGWSLAVTFTFRLPSECPKPLPVEAELTISRRDGSQQVREPVSVLSDLGGYEFAQC